MSFKHKTDVSAAKEQSEEPNVTTLIVELTSGAIAGLAKDTLEDIVREFRDVFAMRDTVNWERRIKCIIT